MALGLELKLRMGMQLVMTPQLQMAIKLLQMSSLELADYLQEELDKNPLLEREDDNKSDDEAAAGAIPELTASEGSEELAGQADMDQMETSLPEDLPVDASWTDIYGDGPGMSSSTTTSTSYDSSSGSEAPPLENTLVRGDTLSDHLIWQLGLSVLHERERFIGTTIIDAIDDNGYLSTDLQTLAEVTGATLDDVEDALVLVQSFEPSGVGSRNLAECLLLQLKNRKQAYPPYTTLLEHLEDLARRDFRKLKRLLKVTDEELIDAVTLIQSLNPKPGLAFGSDQTNYISPDVYVRKYEGKWLVEVNPDTMPKLRVNRKYDSIFSAEGAKSGGRVSAQDKRFLSENARSAQWLIKSLEQRSSTIYRVAESIVRFQKDFLEYGREYLKPLILKDVADDIGVHESTTSRVTSNKYMHTPRGIFELKFFFSSSLVSQSGENHSSESVKYKIRKLVDNESAHRPYSDEKLAVLLKEQGVIVARRTVAKYRDVLNIPSSSRRKQLSPERSR